MEKIIPKGTRVLVSREAPAEKSAGGIILQSGDDMKVREFAAETRATVVAMGELAFEDNPGERPEVGSRVIIQRYSGVAVDSDAKYGDILVNDIHVLAQVEEV